MGETAKIATIAHCIKFRHLVLKTVLKTGIEIANICRIMHKTTEKTILELENILILNIDFSLLRLIECITWERLETAKAIVLPITGLKLEKSKKFLPIVKANMEIIPMKDPSKITFTHSFLENSPFIYQDDTDRSSQVDENDDGINYVIFKSSFSISNNHFNASYVR